MISKLSTVEASNLPPPQMIPMKAVIEPSSDCSQQQPQSKPNATPVTSPCFGTNKGEAWTLRHHDVHYSRQLLQFADTCFLITAGLSMASHRDASLVVTRSVSRLRGLAL